MSPPPFPCRNSHDPKADPRVRSRPLCLLAADFDLAYYTEVQDLSHLSNLLERDPRMSRFSALNSAICELVEDFGLVTFSTLAVEVRATSLFQSERPLRDSIRTGVVKKDAKGDAKLVTER